jgi:hypothetical protein
MANFKLKKYTKKMQGRKEWYALTFVGYLLHLLPGFAMHVSSKFGLNEIHTDLRELYERFEKNMADCS